MRIDPDAIEEIHAALAECERVDDRRISVHIEHDEVVLRGAVATPQEATIAAIVAEEVVPAVVNALQVDPALREGAEDPCPRERVRPAEDELLLHDPDPLAGPGAKIMIDVERTLEESEPLEPPDDPGLGVPDGEAWDPYRPPDPVHAGDDEPDPLDEREDVLPAAADLSGFELRWAAAGRGHLPALDPEAVPPRPEPTPDPSGVEPLGLAPTEAEESDHMPWPLPGSEHGPGAVGEPTTEGGSVGGTPAGATHAWGADTFEADPTRGASGGTMSDLGVERGPSDKGDEEWARPATDHGPPP